MIVDNLVEAIFPVVDANSYQSAILTPTNSSSFHINQQVLARLDKPSKIYLGVTRRLNEDGSEDTTHNMPVEALNSLTPNGMPPNSLELKEGALIMLLRNLDTSIGLCNGTRMLVTALHELSIEAEIVGSTFSGTRHLIPRLRLSPSDADIGFKMEREQIPVRVAYAFTINKSQGQTMDRVGIDLDHPVFSHGQLYVAFSRVKSLNNVKVRMTPCANKQGIASNNVYFTQNVVYNDVLS